MSVVDELSKQLEAKAKQMKRQFRIGQCVRTKSGLEGKVIGSAVYPGLNRVEYRIRIPGETKTLYRYEEDLSPCR